MSGSRTSASLPVTQMEFKDYYQIMGVARDATQDLNRCLLSATEPAGILSSTVPLR